MVRGLDGFCDTRCVVFRGPRASHKFPVVMARGKHLFPFRTEQLSPSAPMVLGPQGPGRVGRRRIIFERPASMAGRFSLWHRPRRRVSADEIRTREAAARSRVARHAQDEQATAPGRAAPAPLGSCGRWPPSVAGTAGDATSSTVEGCPAVIPRATPCSGAGAVPRDPAPRIPPSVPSATRAGAPCALPRIATPARRRRGRSRSCTSRVPAGAPPRTTARSAVAGT